MSKIVNHLDKNAQHSMLVRVRTGIVIAIYFAIVLCFITFSDQRPDGWISWMSASTRSYLTFIFACITIVSLAWTSFFIAKEIDNCFTMGKNWKTICIIMIILLVIQIIPTVIWLLPNYFPNIYKSIPWYSWLILYLCSGVLLSFFSYPILHNMIKGSSNVTKFNIRWFPLIVIGIAYAFSSIYYLGIVRYWTTLIVIIVAVYGCDIFAYFFGVLFGKHKIAPRISPKKTWEGAILGSIFGAIVTALMILGLGYSGNDVHNNFFGCQIDDDWSTGWYWWVLAIAFCLASTVSTILGDLTFSLFKRKNGIKDFGTILPGHGGILDRIDATIVTILIFTFLTTFISLITVIINRNEPFPLRTLFPLMGS